MTARAWQISPTAERRRIQSDLGARVKSDICNPFSFNLDVF